MKERGWEVGELGVPARTKESNGSQMSFAKRRKRKTYKMLCPDCGATIQRVPKLIQAHFFKDHQRKLTEPEAFRIASVHRDTLPRTVPDEAPKRDPGEVSGGLPSLGKRR